MAEEQEGQEQQKGGSKTMLFVIIGAVLVLIIVGVVVIMLMSGGGEEEEEAQTPKQEQKQGAKKPAGSVGTDVALMNVGPILPVTAKEPLIINLSTQGRDAYLSIQLSIGLSSDKLQVEAERKLDIIKDTFIDVFSTKTPEELKTSKGMNRALEEARNRINEFLVDGQVTHIFRTNAFIQQG